MSLDQSFGGGFGGGGGRGMTGGNPILAALLGQMSPMMSNLSSGRTGPANPSVQLWNQYRGVTDPGVRDAMIRQMQGADSGASFNKGMRDAGYSLSGTEGAFDWTAPPTPTYTPGMRGMTVTDGGGMPMAGPNMGGGWGGGYWGGTPRSGAMK